jgi:hypothetical protein
MSRVIDKVDVICEYKSDGSMIPMRFRLMNEEGAYEVYTIKGYRILHKSESYITPDGVMVCSKDRVFECRVLILDMYRTVRLYFNADRSAWKIAI